MAGGGISE